MPPEVNTVRISELTEQTELSMSDTIAVHVSSTNKTRKTSLQTLKDFVATDGGTTYSPVYSGGTIIYVVPEEKEGEDSVVITGIAGKQFKLRRDGQPLIPETEFEILSAGGFKIKTDVLDVLRHNQRFELDVFELSTGAPSSGSGVGSFIKGRMIVNTNLTLSASDVNKVIQLRGDTTSLTIGLPDVTLVEENGFFIIESLINNTKQHKIVTSSEQYLYRANKSLTYIWLGKGEFIWCFRTDDGYFVLNEKGNFEKLTQPKFSYKIDINQLPCEGQLISRSLYPKLTEEVLALGPSLVTDELWNTASLVDGGKTITDPYKGCFSSGDGSTTIRLPDLRNKTGRGLKTNDGSTDSERYYNHPGGFQKNANKKQESNSLNKHGVAWAKNSSDGSFPIKVIQVDKVHYNGNNEEVDVPSFFEGETEARMDNVGFYWVIDY